MSSKDFRNRYPIILVHGFCGWGRDEVFGFKYWGGNVDIEARLNDLHYHTRTATVGPISSSWERAVELYYYIVGGQVDYGAAHAKKYGVKRFGHTFPGIYPQVSDTNKIHLVGHSMGGQTICDFEAFLRNGSQEERDYYAEHPEEGISDLFLGGKHWVHSITGVAPGFNGTTFLDAASGPISMQNLVRQSMLCLASINGGNPADFVYDFKLDQWGLKREKGELFIEYLERIIENDLWKSNNTAFYDLKPSGAAKIARERLQLFPETYYFTYSGKATVLNPKTGYALPRASINPLFYLGSLVIGRSAGNPDLPGNAIDWRDNDGAISCAGTRYVLGQAHRDADPADIGFPAGIWNAFPVMHGWDHFDMTGTHPPHLLNPKDVMPLYSDLARILTSLEPAAAAAPVRSPAMPAPGNEPHNPVVAKHAGAAHASAPTPKKAAPKTAKKKR